jgi:hypothetical protein
MQESTRHFLMACPIYDEIRQTLFTSLRNMNLKVPINYKLLLYSGDHVDPGIDLEVQEHLSKFIIDSKRFLNYQNLKD